MEKFLKKIGLAKEVPCYFYGYSRNIAIAPTLPLASAINRDGPPTVAPDPIRKRACNGYFRFQDKKFKTVFFWTREYWGKP